MSSAFAFAVLPNVYHGDHILKRIVVRCYKELTLIKGGNDVNKTVLNPSLNALRY
jgi:hypothetical protein